MALRGRAGGTPAVFFQLAAEKICQPYLFRSEGGNANYGWICFDVFSFRAHNEIKFEFKRKKKKKKRDIIRIEDSITHTISIQSSRLSATSSTNEMIISTNFHMDIPKNMDVVLHIFNI